MKKRLLGMVCLLLTAAGTLADSHWTVNPHAFQYDMTAYVTLAWVEQSDYEVAAFCGDECRGVGKLLTATDGTQVFQLRIRSNEPSGETISFRVYNTETEEEFIAEQAINFEPQAVTGTPSEPLVLKFGTVLKGDVNGDGQITPQDASLILQIIAKKIKEDAEGISIKAVDVNDDGLITPQDASLILQYIAKKISW